MGKLKEFGDKVGVALTKDLDGESTILWDGKTMGTLMPFKEVF